MKKTKIITSILLVVLVVSSIFLSGCGTNVSFYIGTSQSSASNTKLAQYGKTEFTQKKVKIENGKTVYSKNSKGEYDSLYFTFSGNNIKHVTFSSSKSRIINPSADTAVFNNEEEMLNKIFEYSQLKNKKVKIAYSDTESKNSARWLYEMLYNKADGKDENYGCIGKDKITANVTFNNKMSRKYKISCSLYADGKITVSVL